MTGARRGLAAVFTLLWVLLGSAAAGPAAAHAVLESSDPENGAELKVAPKQITLTFSERVRPVRKSFSLTDDAGDALRLTQPPAATSRTVVTTMPAGLEPGFYLFDFRVISEDNHPVHGSVAFNLTGKSATTTAKKAPAAALRADDGSDTVSVVAGVNRWVGYVGAVLLLGVAGFVRLCWGAGAKDRRVRGLVLVGAVLVPLAALAAIPIQAAQTNGTGLRGAFSDGRLGDVLDARYGETMLLRIGFALALTVSLVVSARRPTRWPTTAAAVAAAGVALTYARAGHPAAGEYPALTMADDAVHLGAVSLWLAGLLVLAVRVLPRPPVDCADVLRSWSRVAIGAVTVLAVTGVIQAARELRSVSALFDTEYGRWILAKTVVLVVMLVLANLGRAHVRRWAEVMPPLRVPAGASLGAKLADPAPAHRREQREASRLRRSVAAELVLGVAVLVLTAFLAVTSPPGHG